MNLILPKTPSSVLTKDLIPWHDSRHTMEARKVLQKMYNSLEGKEKEFIDKNAKGLLEVLKGSTNLPTDFLSPDSIKSRERTVQVDASTIFRFGEAFQGMNCIYSFSMVSFDPVGMYIGQTQSIMNRLHAHVAGMRGARTNHLLYAFAYQNGMSAMVFSVHLVGKSYQTLWLEQNSSITPEFLVILKAFNEYHLAIYELALLQYYRPGLNSNYFIAFSFMN